MPIVSFSQKDLLRSKLVEPGWYLLHIDDISEKPSKDGGSTNYPVEATIVQNDDTGDKEFAGVPADWNFNSKALGFAVGFLAALGVEVKPEQRIELSAAKGKRIAAFIKRGEYNNQPRNEVTHQYRVPKSV